MTESNYKEYEPTLENYISNEYSVCREERQYALFLNNILLKYRDPDSRDETVQKIFEACGLSEAAIINVFYEATFMRDIFERNRRVNFGKISPKDSLHPHLQVKQRCLLLRPSRILHNNLNDGAYFFIFCNFLTSTVPHKEQLK